MARPFTASNRSFAPSVQAIKPTLVGTCGLGQVLRLTRAGNSILLCRRARAGKLTPHLPRQYALAFRKCGRGFLSRKGRGI